MKWGQLTHWGRATHKCVGKLTIIGPDNGLAPGRHQAIIWTNAGILLIGPLGTNIIEILIGIHTFSLQTFVSYKICIHEVDNIWNIGCFTVQYRIYWTRISYIDLGLYWSRSNKAFLRPLYIMMVPMHGVPRGYLGRNTWVLRKYKKRCEDWGHRFMTECIPAHKEYICAGYAHMFWLRAH